MVLTDRGGGLYRLQPGRDGYPGTAGPVTTRDRVVPHALPASSRRASPVLGVAAVCASRRRGTGSARWRSHPSIRCPVNRAGVLFEPWNTDGTIPKGHIWFGRAVALSEKIALVTAPFDSEVGFHSGAVFVFKLSQEFFKE